MYKNLFHAHLNEYFSDSIKINIMYSNHLDFQYQIFLGKNLSSEKTNDLLNFLNKKGFYEKLEITGKGFLSVKFKLMKFENKNPLPQKIIVDYCGANVAKKMHIGHIRSMFIGDYLVRLHEKLGDDVIKVNHIGDWGNQFGYLLNYIIKYGDTNKLDNQKLSQYYKKSYSLYKEDENFAKESDSIAWKLQNMNDDTIYQLWKKCQKISIDDMGNIFKILDIKMTPDDIKGESFYVDYLESIVSDLLQKNIATKCEDNSVVVFFDDKSPLVLKKSNGNYLYAVYDLAAIQYRCHNYNPDKILYVVDKRQELHFNQVFDVAEKAGYSNNNVVLSHVVFGTILGNDKKPLKSKSGDSLYLEDLLDEGKEILLMGNYYQKEENKKQEIISKTLIGALKFYDLKFNKKQDYIFDWKSVLNLGGNSAPYIQNVVVRIDAILKKSNYLPEENIFDIIWETDEQEMLYQTQKIQEILNSKSYETQIIADELIKLCSLFHKYYEKEYVIGNKKEHNKISLLNYIMMNIIDITDVLGISCYESNQKDIKNDNQNTSLKF